MRDSMKPSTPKLTLPKGTLTIVVDPLNDFMSAEGVFAKAYGLPDTQPVRDLLPVLRSMMEAWKTKAHVLLCRSLYRHDQFGVRGLENLCTEGNRVGRDSEIPESFFRRDFEKTDNSILETEDDEVKGRISTAQHLILAGVTTTSCLPKSVVHIRQVYPGHPQIIVPRDAVAARKERQADAEALLKAWEDEGPEGQVTVVPSWKDIRFK